MEGTIGSIRRRVLVPITDVVFADMCKEGACYKIESGLPQDAVFLGANYDPQRQLNRGKNKCLEKYGN